MFVSLFIDISVWADCKKASLSNVLSNNYKDQTSKFDKTKTSLILFNWPFVVILIKKAWASLLSFEQLLIHSNRQ